MTAVDLAVRADIERITAAEHHDPHRVLGPHRDRGGVTVRAWRPDATSVSLAVGDQRIAMERVHPLGLFAVRIDGDPIPDYRFEIVAAGRAALVDDAYRFWPTLGDLDVHLFGEGRHEALWKALGCHPRVHQGVAGCSFAVWAPNARSVRVVGDFNSWDGRIHAMRMLGSSGVWEIFVPGVGAGVRYKFEVLTADGGLALRADPFAFQCELRPATASVATAPAHEWQDQEWIARRSATNPLETPVSVYECHLGSWRLAEQGGGWRQLTYRELADQLPDYVAELGFTHVELLPVAEHPFDGSWGYQVTGYYAPTARHGSPDDFRYLVDRLHQRGIGVIVDWVAAHFPRDAWALARFDGTALYEHADPRQGEHPDWGTLVFNVGRHEVRNFLLANVLFWIDEYHIDGLRVDAVASMLYLDYSRNGAEWLPNRLGGRENLEAIDFLRETNAVVHRAHPGVMMIAEESTSWPAVSRPAHLGGLGFGFKWNMGWMNDTLVYFTKDPVHRRWHHHQLPSRCSTPSTRTSSSRSATTRSPTASGRCSRRCPGIAGSSSPTCAPCSAGCGRTRGASCSSWAARSARATSGGTTAASTGTCSSTRSTAVSRTSSASSTAATSPSPRSGNATSTGAASAGSTATTPTTACSPSCASPPTAAGCSPASPTSPRWCATATASVCPPAAAGARCSTPTPRSSPGAVPATARSRRSRCPGAPSSTRRRSPFPRSR